MRKRKPMSPAARAAMKDVGMSLAEVRRVDDALEVASVLFDQLPEGGVKIALLAMVTTEMMACSDPLQMWDGFQRTVDGLIRARIRAQAGVPAGVVPS